MPPIADAKLAVGSLTATLATEQLRLAYDASNYVQFVVSAAGGLTLNPKAGQSVTFPILAVTSTAVITGATRFGDSVRLDSGAVPTLPTTGAGLEMWYGALAGGAAIQAYDRDGAAYKPLLFGASRFRFTDGVVRIEGVGTVPTTGAGLEIFYTAATATLQAYNRDTALYTGLSLQGLTIGFYPGVTPVARQLLATGAGATVDNVITALQALGLVRQT